MVDQNGKADHGEKLETRQQGFIPGLPNSLVLEHISSKIPWRSMYPLTWLSHEWRQAIRSREIYDTRKRCDASMVIVPVEDRHNLQKRFHDVDTGDTYVFPVQGKHIAHYAPPGLACIASESASFDFVKSSGPIIPQRKSVLESGLEFSLKKYFPRGKSVLESFLKKSFQASKKSFSSLDIADNIVVLDGKLYTIQESRSSSQEPHEGMIEIHVLDAGACDWEWRRCCKWTRCPDSWWTFHSEQASEIWVACDAKIYFFHLCKGCFHGIVFDPEKEVVTEIKNRERNVCFPMYSCLHMHPFRTQVAVLDKNIYVGQPSRENMMVFDSRTETWHTIANKLSFDGQVTNFTMLVMKEKLYAFSKNHDFAIPSIQVYNMESNSWTKLKGNFVKYLMGDSNNPLCLVTVAPYRDEVVGVLYEVDASVNVGTMKFTEPKFCRSVCFGAEGGKLTLEDIPELSVKCVLSRVSDLRLDSLEL